MEILAFNSSPRKSKGATDIVLNEFLKGIESVKDSRVKIEKVYLSEKK